MALDEYLHFDEWKTVDDDPYYDWKLVRKVRIIWCDHMRFFESQTGNCQ